MFSLIEEEIPRSAEECAECMESYDNFSYCGLYGNMCFHCEKRIKTTFTCPNCQKIRVFFDKANPGYCEGCKILFPNITDLKDSPTKRMNYHNREGNL